MRCRSNHNRINPQSTVRTQLKRDAVCVRGARRNGEWESEVAERRRTKTARNKRKCAKEFVRRKCERKRKWKQKNMKNERMLVNCLDNKKFNTLSDITICNWTNAILDIFQTIFHHKMLKSFEMSKSHFTMAIIRSYSDDYKITMQPKMKRAYAVHLTKDENVRRWVLTIALLPNLSFWSDYTLGGKAILSQAQLLLTNFKNSHKINGKWFDKLEHSFHVAFIYLPLDGMRVEYYAIYI